MKRKILVYVGYKTINYGSMLQAFATLEMLKKMGAEPVMLNLDGLWKEIKRRKMKFYLLSGDLTFLLQSKGRMYFSKLYEKLNLLYGKRIKERRNKFENFVKHYLVLTDEVNGFCEVSALAEKYDIVLLGSDQVWLPSSVVTDVYTLGFVKSPYTVKVAYAPSFGINKIPDKYKDKYEEMLKSFNYVSVRETSGRNIVREITGIDCPVVADPVMMLSRTEWEEKIPYQKKCRFRYIFVYLIGNNRWQREWIKQYAVKRHLETVALVHLDAYIPYDKKYFDHLLIEESPADFLNWIRNADEIFTDSYHCMLFSLIENKNVWCFRRFDDQKKVSTNSRLYTILVKFGLGKRLLGKNSRIEDCILDEIDFQSVNEMLSDFQRESWDYLLNFVK